MKLRNWMIKLMLVLYDVFAVNASFFLALVVRFYINGSFSELGVPYISAFFSYAPYYTVCTLIVFALFHMYDMVWRVAGINDLKRILLADVCTFLIQIIGSRIFVRRMPTTYYIIGAVIQLALVCLVRFIPRILFYEGFQGREAKDATPVMIVGVGPDAVTLQDRIRKNENGREKVVCMVDHSSRGGGRRLFNGLPVIYGIENIPDAIRKYGIGQVFIAERGLPEEARREIGSLCAEEGVELKSFIVGMADDEETREWLKRYEEENGEEASFF